MNLHLNRFRAGKVGTAGAVAVAMGIASLASVVPVGASPNPHTSHSQLAAAKAEVAIAMKTPTGIDQTIPLKTKPPKGKTVVWLQCELSSCADMGKGIKAAATALGWHYKQLNFLTSDSTTLITALHQALIYKPTAVSFSGAPQALWASVLPAYRAAKVPIIPVVIGPNRTSPDVPVNLGDFTQGGTSLGDWFISNSNGKGHALIVDIPAFPVLTEYKTGALRAIAKNCSSCVTTNFEGTLTEVGSGTLVPDIVAALQKDPSVNYVLCSDDIFISSLPSALKAAGITNVKIAGGQPEPSDLQNITSGSESAGVNISNTILGWEVVDSVARWVEGMKIPYEDGGTKQQLLVASNVKSDNLTSYVTPTNYPSLYKKLWKVG